MPEGHEEQEAWPAEGLKVPAAQGAHDTAPLPPLKEPAAQETHEGWPVLGWYLPASQEVQDDAPLPL